MTQTPTPASMFAQDDETDITEIQVSPSSNARLVSPPSSFITDKDVNATDEAAGMDPSLLGEEPLEMTELKYYSATESRRLRSRMMTASLQTSATPTNASSSGKWLSKRWGNLSLRNKFIVLILLSSSLPTIAVTQSLISLNKGRAIQETETRVILQTEAFNEATLQGAHDSATVYSSNLAQVLELQKIDPSASQSDNNTAILSRLVALPTGLSPDQAMNFQIVVDLKGRNVAQDIWLPNGNQPVAKNLATAQDEAKLTQATAPLNQDIRRFPLVQQVLSSGVGAAGIERLAPETSQQLNFTTSQQAGKELLTALSIEPILINGRTRGAVITGKILNGNHILADAFKFRSGLSAISLFDGKELIFSTAMGANSTGRRTTETVAPSILEKVLKQGEKYVEVEYLENIICLHYYLPVLSQSTGKPIGMIHALEILNKQESQFLRQQLLAYGLGGGLILLSMLLALPAANSLVRPLKRLSVFMNQLSKGDRGLRLSDASRQDEVGMLSLSMNRLAGNLENKEFRLQTALWQNEILTEVANLRSLDSHEITEGLTLVLEKTRKKLKLDRLVVYRCGSTTETGRVVYEARLPKWPSSIELGISDSCIPAQQLEQYRQGEIQVNPDVTQASLSQPHLALLDQLNVKASIIAPMVGGDALYGLLVAHSCGSTRQWQESTVSFMASLADRVAAAIGYVTLVEQQNEAEEVIRRDKEILQSRALELLQEVDPVSKGDLTVRAKVTPDEIGTVADSYNATIESLRKIVTQVQNVSGQVTSTAQSNDIAVKILAQDALAQAEKITGSLYNLEAMRQSVQQLATQAREAQVIVDQTQSTVNAGEQAMVRTVEGMASIRESVSETTQRMESLEAASERISNVIRLISGFAAQTHMLAMKASIEAARAGDEGEGFAVIADEVRSLAAQSAQATADVETVINTIQMATQDVITAMQVENSQVAKQMELVEETRASLTQITAASAEVNQLVSDIAQTTESQTQTSDATAAIITEVAELVRHTSEEASHVSDSFKELVDVSEALQSEVAQFKVS